MEDVKWTYDRVQEYVEEQRELASREGCKECRKVASLVLIGRPTLSRMIRGGYGIERIKEAIAARGWYCKGCAQGYAKTVQEEKLRPWGKVLLQQQQLNKKTTRDDALRYMCEEWAEESRKNPDYKTYLVTLHDERLAGRMVKALQCGAGDMDEAFFMAKDEILESS